MPWKESDARVRGTWFSACKSPCDRTEWWVLVGSHGDVAHSPHFGCALHTPCSFTHVGMEFSPSLLKSTIREAELCQKSHGSREWRNDRGIQAQCRQLWSRLWSHTHPHEAKRRPRNLHPEGPHQIHHSRRVCRLWATCASCLLLARCRQWCNMWCRYTSLHSPRAREGILASGLHWRGRSWRTDPTLSEPMPMAMGWRQQRILMSDVTPVPQGFKTGRVSRPS